MLRSPRRLTQIELFMNGRIRIVNGTLFDMEPRRQDIENKVRAGLLRKIDKWLAFKALSHFLFCEPPSTCGQNSHSKTLSGPGRKGPQRQGVDSVPLRSVE